MTYTPRPNLQRDKIARMQKQINELVNTKTLRSASIGSGGITVEDGGGITIEDQGILEVDNGGIIVARHLNGQRAFFVGPSIDEQSYAFLVENPDGFGMIRYYTLPDNSSYVYLGHETGLPRITMWGSSVNMHVSGTNEFSFYHEVDRRTMVIARTGTDATSIVGGSDVAGALYTRIKMQGPGTGAMVDIRNGADSGYVSIRASAFTVSSSRELKEDLGLMADGALETVKNVPVRRWKFLEAPATTGDEDEVGVAGDNPERIGPFAEDVSMDMGTPGAEDPEERNISSDSLWVLWKAVQELSAKVTEQEKTIKDLQERLDKAGI